MGQHRALYQIGGISPGQKNDFTTARPLAKARDFRSGSIATETRCPNYIRSSLDSDYIPDADRLR
jgi:hypothetical protein